MRRYHPLNGAELGEILTAQITSALTAHHLFQSGLTYPLARIEVVLALDGQPHRLTLLEIAEDTPPDAIRARYGLSLLDTVQMGSQVVDVANPTLTVPEEQVFEPLAIGSYVHHPQYCGDRPLRIVGISNGFYEVWDARTNKQMGVGMDSVVGRGFKLVEGGV